MNKLTAIKRSKTDKLDAIRNNGMVPAVVYGVRVENTMVSVSSVDFQKILKIAGESSTIILEITDENKKELNIEVCDEFKNCVECNAVTCDHNCMKNKNFILKEKID